MCGRGTWLLRARSCVVAALAIAAAGIPQARPASLLDTPHPGRLRAIRDYGRGAEALRAGDLTTARQALERAIACDPLQLPAWIALAALRIDSCDRPGARAAALVATRLAPDDDLAREAWRRATALDCESRATTAHSLDAEIALADRAGDYRAWAEAAAARRERGDGLVAALYEEQALDLGGEPAIRWMKLARDLERAGLLRSALAAWHEQGGADAADEIARLERAIADLEPSAAAIAAILANAKSWPDPQARRGLADLALAALAADPESDRDAVLEQLEDLLGLPRAAVMRGAWGRMPLQEGWAAGEIAEPGIDPPAVLLRRFPGDTGIALFDSGMGWIDGAPGRKRVRERLLEGRAAEAAGAWEECNPAPAAAHCEVQPWRVTDGGDAASPVLLFRLAAVRPDGAPGREVWLVGWSGDAGCGSPCREQAQQALNMQVAAVAPSTEPPPSPAAEAAARPLSWPVPPSRGDGPASEREEPWRRVALGEGLVVEVPPGVLVARVGPRFRDETAGPDTALWLRGAFQDQDGVAVTIGAPGWAGWVDVRRAADAAGASPPPPRTDPGARPVAETDLTPAREAAGLEGVATTARFEGKAFDGTWIVHRVRAGDRLVEIVLPLATGERSLAPLWMAVTARREATEAPPPPFDLSQRYRLRIERMSISRSPADPREGILVSDEVQLFVPKGFRASLNAESPDGFPVTLRDDQGSQITVRRFPPRQGGVAGRRFLEGRWGAPPQGWKEVRSRRSGTVESASFPGPEPDHPARSAALLVPAHPDQAATFLVEFVPGQDIDAAAWAAASTLVTNSIKPR